MKILGILAVLLGFVLIGAGCNVSEKKENKPSNENKKTDSKKTPNVSTKIDTPSEGS